MMYIDYICPYCGKDVREEAEPIEYSMVDSDHMVYCHRKCFEALTQSPEEHTTMKVPDYI